MSDFHAELVNDIAIRASGSGLFKTQAFAEELGSRLEDAEEIFDLTVEPVSCLGRRRKRLEILGYAEDGGDDSLIVLVGTYFGVALSKLHKTDADRIFDWGKSFVDQAASGVLHSILEPSSKEYEYAEYLRSNIHRFDQLRLFLITDGIMSERIKHIPNEQVAGLDASFEIWDLNRFQGLAESLSGKEDIDILFSEWMPDGLPVLASQDESDNRTFVGVIPGNVLAEIYRRYGTRLLESNVRTFLSARGKVNRGIQQTLRQNPGMFLAFNNGLSTTASDIVSYGDGDIRFIENVTNWQIVNGGQTTASLAHYLKNNSDGSLDDVYVQMKLVLVKPEDAAERVAEISRYANNQNKVSEADFFSNSEYHRHMSKLSAKILAPRIHGAQYGTRWFYERTRGEYDNARANRKASEVRIFDLEVPKSQKISKTDWAKFLNSWGQKPHLVSKGAQTNFLDFAGEVTAKWEKGTDSFGEQYFKSGVAKALLFNDVRRIVLNAEWYETGYLANIVTYTLAKISFEIPRFFPGYEMDFDSIWRQQKMPESASRSVENVAEAVLGVLTAPDRPQANVTQWAKQEACWDRVKQVVVHFESDFRDSLVDVSAAKAARSDSRRLQSMDSEFVMVERLLKVSSDVWDVALTTGVTEGLLTSTQVGVIRKLALGTLVPNARQAKSAISGLERLADFGVIAKSSF